MSTALENERDDLASYKVELEEKNMKLEEENKQLQASVRANGNLKDLQWKTEAENLKLKLQIFEAKEMNRTLQDTVKKLESGPSDVDVPSSIKALQDENIAQDRLISAQAQNLKEKEIEIARLRNLIASRV